MRFSYLEAKTVDEAVSLLTKYKGKAKAMAGGTDLYVQMRDKVLKPEYVVDLTYIRGLDYIKYDAKEGLRIGALTTIREIEESDKIKKHYPVLAQAAGLLGSVAIRNVATLGGNLSNAAPSADTAPALIGLGAMSRIAGPKGERVVPVEDFCTGPGCIVAAPGEILVEILVPTPAPGTKGVYLKHSRTAVDLALVGVAVVLVEQPKGTCKDCRIVLGAVAPTPMRAKKAEGILIGNKLTADLIAKAGESAMREARPISDVRASADYRREIIKVLTRRGLEQLVGSR